MVNAAFNPGGIFYLSDFLNCLLIKKHYQNLNYLQNDRKNDFCHLSLNPINVLKRIILTNKLIFLISRP
jgi:hypothetical protein